MAELALARHAMATRFELLLHGPNPTALRSAGEEALDEIERRENRLSLYRPASEVSHINARGAYEPVRISPSVFSLLQQAARLHEQTGGAFDITMAPLVRCWGFMGGTGKWPEPEAVETARAQIGFQHVQLDAANYTVRFSRPGMMLDLGAIGKGYAVECAAEILREAGVTSALLHGGTSTVCAIGAPPDANAWSIALTGSSPPLPGVSLWPPADLPGTVSLKDESLSVSAVWGRCFEHEGKSFGHILDPRTGWPARQAILSAVIATSSTETDALSTGLLVLGQGGLERLNHYRPGSRAAVTVETSGGLRTHTIGF